MDDVGLIMTAKTRGNKVVSVWPVEGLSSHSGLGSINQCELVIHSIISATSNNQVENAI